MGASNCNSGLDNGSYTITDIFEDGASVAATGDYTYEFFDNGGTSIQGPNNTNSVSGLAPGNYSVIITRSSSQCASASLPFTISDESTAPNAALSKTDNSDCSGATANGSINGFRNARWW